MFGTTKAHSTLIIAFQGLMHFQTGKNKLKHVAIVDAQDYHCPHSAEIRIWHDGTLGNPISLCKGDVVSFSVPPGKLQRDSLYRKHVPKLKDFIHLGDVDPKVRRQLPADGVMAYVTLPPGRLTTWSTFKNPVELLKHNGRRKLKCFARFVVLETTIAKNVDMIVHRENPPSPPEQKSYLLIPEDVVFVRNTNPTRDDNGYQPHFPAYAKLLRCDGQVSPVRLRSDIQCDRSEGKGQFSKAVEEALEANRHYAPNGDCGPTGP